MKKLSKYCTIGLYLVFIGMVIYHVWSVYFLVLILVLILAAFGVFCSLFFNKKDSETINEKKQKASESFKNLLTVIKQK